MIDKKADGAGWRSGIYGGQSFTAYEIKIYSRTLYRHIGKKLRYAMFFIKIRRKKAINE